LHFIRGNEQGNIAWIFAGLNEPEVSNFYVLV